MAGARRPGEEIFEGSETVPKFSKIEGKREEEEDDEEIMWNDEKIMSSDDDVPVEAIKSLYDEVPSKERQLEDGWESEGNSCFHGRHVYRTDGRGLVRILGDIMENRDKIRQVLNHHQDAWHSQGFNIQNDVPLPYKAIDVLNYECEDPILKDNIYYHVQLAIDVYNKKFGGQLRLPVRWAFTGSCRALRKYGLKGAYFEFSVKMHSFTQRVSPLLPATAPSALCSGSRSTSCRRPMGGNTTNGENNIHIGGSLIGLAVFMNLNCKSFFT